MTALMVLLVLAAFVAAGAAARIYLPPHTGRHTAAYLSNHPVTAAEPHRIDIGEWVNGKPARPHHW